MTDIVDQLRSLADKRLPHSVGELWNGLDAAADEIERLRYQIKEEQLHTSRLRQQEAHLLNHMAVLEQRLEYHPGFPDGIDCRNAAIAGQGREIDRLRNVVGGLEARLEQQLASRAVPGPTDNELAAFAAEEQFLLFCDTDEFIDIARAVLHRFAAAPQPETPAPAPPAPAEVEGERIYQHWCRELIAALKRLSFAAQTTGGTAGRDDELCKSIDQAEKALSLTAASRAIDSAEVEREALARADKACGVIRALLDGKTEYWAGQIRQQLGHVRTEIGLMLEGWQARAQLGAVPEPHPVFKFLLGEGELEGLWFGDRCDDRPAFWWRHHLRAALAAQPTQEQPHD